MKRIIMPLASATLCLRNFHQISFHSGATKTEASVSATAGVVVLGSAIAILVMRDSPYLSTDFADLHTCACCTVQADFKICVHLCNLWTTALSFKANTRVY